MNGAILGSNAFNTWNIGEVEVIALPVICRSWSEIYIIFELKQIFKTLRYEILETEFYYTTYFL